MPQTAVPENFNIEDPADIIKGLEAGSYELILEHSKGGHSPWCARTDCLVQQLPGVNDDRIRARYRIRLTGTGYNHNSRCFHVSCVESSAIDMGRYLERARPANSQPYEVAGAVLFFHPAVCDWIDYGGKALDADQYDQYSAALVKYRHRVREARSLHNISCLYQCVCGLSILELPKRDTLASGTPTVRFLSDVLLQIKKAAPVGPITIADRIALVEGITKTVPFFEKDNLPSGLASIFEVRSTVDVGGDAGEHLMSGRAV